MCRWPSDTSSRSRRASLGLYAVDMCRASHCFPPLKIPLSWKAPSPTLTFAAGSTRRDAVHEAARLVVGRRGGSGCRSLVDGMSTAPMAICLPYRLSDTAFDRQYLRSRRSTTRKRPTHFPYKIQARIARRMARFDPHTTCYHAGPDERRQIGRLGPKQARSRYVVTSLQRSRSPIPCAGRFTNRPH
jgi:hypothetical protein